MKKKQDSTLRKQKRLKSILRTYNIPSHRLSINKNNLFWLNKNIQKHNASKPDFNIVSTIIKEMIQNKEYDA